MPGQNEKKINMKQKQKRRKKTKKKNYRKQCIVVWFGFSRCYCAKFCAAVVVALQPKRGRMKEATNNNINIFIYKQSRGLNSLRNV